MTAAWRGAVLATLVAALALGAQTAAPASPRSIESATAAPYAAAIRESRALLQDSVRPGGITGLAIAVMSHGTLVWSEGFGWADLENRLPVWPETRFRIGSVSKPISAAAVAQLVEAGKLDLDAPVQRYVPSFPVKKWPITTRLVAGHLSGIRHYRGDETFSMKHYADVRSGLAIFASDSLLFKPGTRFSYSSYGWNLVSAVVEGASGEPFLSYMQHHVFDPLQLHSITPEYPDSLIPHRAHFYERDSTGAWHNAPYVDNSYKWAGGGFLSTADDLARYADAYLRPGFLRPETVRLLWTSMKTNAGTPTDYGIGWGVETDSAGRRKISHGGSSVGANAYLLVYPDQQLVVAVLANMETAFVGHGTAADLVARRFLP